MIVSHILLLIALLGDDPAQSPPPKPLEPIPSPRQLAWQELEYCAFFHFGMNTFTDREWGDGTESEETFAPTALDCKQWARVAKEAGMKGVILTAKHHDGFCLWPSKLTEHSVKNSPWKDGKGDVVRDLSDACRAEGLKFGVYLSPWDRNQPCYGDTEKYNDYYVAQLTELLTNYGDIFEVWFDGACGEGPNGKKQVYDWKRYIETVRKLQPNAVMFSDAGPDIRWVGNENGFAGETCWSMLKRDKFYPGTPDSKELTAGHIDGDYWVPPECDVSIRPGWFYHAAEDDKVKSVEQLMRIWYGSVGRNGSLLLNLPIDRTGRVNEHDVARLMEFRKQRDAVFGDDLAKKAWIGAARSRGWKSGDDPRFLGKNLIDDDPSTYFATEDDDSAGITMAWDKRVTIDHIVITEPVALGQRESGFEIRYQWFSDFTVGIAQGTTIGHKRIFHFAPITTEMLFFDFKKTRDGPHAISSIEVYGPPSR